jgi:hypothetical protein
MDIKKKRYNIDDSIKKIMDGLKIERDKLKLKGSYSLASQRYFSDIDLYQNVNIKNPKLLFSRLFKVLEYVKSNYDMYFIELKFQNGDEKIKFEKGDKFNEEKFNESLKNNTDYIKLDVVLYFNYKLIEVSVNYYLHMPEIIENVPNEELIKEFRENIKELKKERNFYKVLKRIFSINKELGNKEELVKLTNFFNSDIGAYYSKLSNLQAIKLLSEKYKDIKAKKMIASNLNQLDIRDKDVNKEINKLQEYVNEQALLFINKNNIKI